MKRQMHGPDVVTIYFRLKDGSALQYEAGQYITVYFDGSSTPAGKAYSLSSAPHEELMSITVKNVGEFSGLLHSLHVGDSFTISDAYGFFNPGTKQPLVCISAGVGIAPIWSVLKQEYQHDAARISHLFCSSHTVGDIVFHDELERAAGAYGALSLHHHITRQSEVPVAMHRGRIHVDDCLRVTAENAAFLLCGSVEFVRDMWRQLTEKGVAAERISTETFFE